MRGVLFSVLTLFFLADYELGLPPQPDLDLPIVLGHYDPANPAPGPVPRGPETDDPRDEPPPVFFGEEIPTESGSLIYVIDYSGSMDFAGRIDRARQEFARSVSELPPSFKLNVILYDCTLLQWSPHLRPATPEGKAEAIRWVESHSPAGGGTGTGPAVALALAEKGNMAVALLTDGDPNCGAIDIADHRAMIRNVNTQRATISVFGIDAWGEYRTFCQAVAADSGGSYHDVVVAPPAGGKSGW